IGGAGDDLIFGGLGGNTLTGGAGQDLFVLSGVNLPKTPNTITDFNLLDDTIQVDLATGGKVSDVTTTVVGTDTSISFGSTQLAIVKNAKLSANDIIISTFVPIPIAGISLAQNLLTTDTTVTGFGVSAIAQKAGTKVNEIGIFAVDDATGKVGGIAVGEAGYLKAVTDSARPIFASLGGTFFSRNRQEIGLDPNKTYQFFQVQDGSIADLQQQLASNRTPTNILFARPDASGNSPIKVTNNSTNDGYRVSVNNDELVLNVAKLDGATPNIAIGAKSQGLAQGRTIDLTGFAATPIKVDITTTSSAGYNNNIGFYAVEDAIGTIKLASGTTLKPGDANYAIEAIRSVVLQAGKTDSKTNQDLVGGKLYAPVIVAQGSLTDFVSRNVNNNSTDPNAIHAYFNYLGANPDQIDHFRLLGNNTFGVEDLYGGGDRDFNDVVVNINVKTA
ncbi:DUF4114 domain-containing protein, partial [Chamaesiphon sp.]|uniref:DUF4114 domain-containing protein n=1 Tax=Chamaesiphon sp. TaxID=2814140 RepID=UPI0035946CFE